MEYSKVIESIHDVPERIKRDFCNVLSADVNYPGIVQEIDTIDFRLRYHDDTLYLHTGDAQYDTDHRGVVEAGTIEVNADMSKILERFNDVLERVQDRSCAGDFINA